MAIVYRGLDRRLRRAVAIKVIRPELTNTPDVVLAFHREVAATSKLEHPNIVNIFDHGEVGDNWLFMVMELLQGQSLASLLEEQSKASTVMPWRRAVNIVQQVCGALTAAHARGVVHHDITPANIFCVRGHGIRADYVKVLDFGISKVTASARSMTLAQFQERTNEPMRGTPYYIAPEALRGERTGPAVDIYGLGVVLYEMCTGVRPFVQENLYALLYSITYGQLRRPRDANPQCELSEAAEEVIMRAMSRDLAERYSSPEALADALEATLESAPAGRTPATKLEFVAGSTSPSDPAAGPACPSPGKRTGRALAPWALGAMLVAALLMAIWLAFVRGTDPEPAKRTAPTVASRDATSSTTSDEKKSWSSDRLQDLGALRDRREERLDEYIRGRRDERLSCVKQVSTMLGAGYELPVFVTLAADGSAKATVDDKAVLRDNAVLFPSMGHACVLALIEGVKLDQESAEILVNYTVRLEE